MKEIRRIKKNAVKIKIPNSKNNEYIIFDLVIFYNSIKEKIESLIIENIEIYPYVSINKKRG